MWIQPDTSQKLAVCFVKPFAFSAVDMGDNIKKTLHKTKPNTLFYLAEGIISEAQELVQHSNIGEKKGYSEEEYCDMER